MTLCLTGGERTVVEKSAGLCDNGYMEIVILDSAYKHNISKQSILFCLLHFQCDLIIDGPPAKRLLLGFDHKGIALEIVAIEDDEQDRLVVIHAMKLRKQFSHLLSGEDVL